MNPELPKNPREEMELRLTALLLGELSAAEAAAVRAAIAKDPELTRLHDDLNQTIHLVRQATTKASVPTTEQTAQLHLSDERRKKLLTHFAIPPLKESDRKPKPLFRLGLVEWAAGLAIIAVVTAVSVTFLSVSRRDKGQVYTATDQAVARLAADAASQRALAQALDQTHAAPGSGPSNVHSLNVVGYYNVPIASGQRVTLGSAGSVTPVPKPSTSAELLLPRVTAKLDGTPPSPPPPEASVATVTPTTPVLLARQRSQIVLPSLVEAADGKATDETLRENGGVASASPFVGDPDFVGVLRRNGRDATSTAELPVSQNGFTSRYAFIASNNTFALQPPTDEKSKEQESDKLSPAKPDASRIMPAPSRGWSKSISLGESNFEPIGRATVTNSFSAGNYSGGINVAGGNRGAGGSGGGGAGSLRFFTSANSYATAGAVFTPAAPGENTEKLDSFSVVPNTPAIDPSTGLPLAVESGFVESRLAGAEGVTAITRRLELPGVVASTTAPVTHPGLLVLDETRRPAEVAGIKLEAEGALQVNAAKVPVLGDLPSAGKLFRSESRTSETESSGQRSYDRATRSRQLTQLGTDSRGETSREERGADALTVTGANNLGDGITVVGGNTALALPQPEQNKSLSEDQLITGGLRITPEAKERLGESSPLASADSPQQKQGNIPRVDVAGSAAGPAKSVENFGKIVLPAAPQDSGSPADAKEPKLATVPSRSLRLPAIERAGESETLQKKIASVQQEAQEQRTKLYVSAGKPAGPTQTDVLQAGRTVSDVIALELDGETATKSKPYFEKKRELEELVFFGRILNNKLAAEKIDLSLPKTTMVEVMDNAVPAKEKTGFWRRLGAPVGGAFASTARVKVERDATDIEGMAGSRTTHGFDPFFIQTEFEALKSDAVLGKVVDDLKLDEAWAAKPGQKLKKTEAISQLKSRLELQPVKNTSLVEVRAKSADADEAAKIANAVTTAYKDHRQSERLRLLGGGIRAIEGRFKEQQAKITAAQKEVGRLRAELKISDSDATGTAPPLNIPAVEPDAPPVRKASTNAPIPQPEIQTSENNFSTFSLNVSDVSFKLAAASLEKGQMPDAASVRSEEFINAFDYRDPEAPAGMPIAFAWERARYPFAHNRDLLRFSLKTAAAGRQAGRALNIVLLLDNSGSMERADRVQIIRGALRVLASQLQPQDKLSVITFARTPRLFADGISGDKAGEVAEQVSGLTPQGGTNLEDAMNLAYQTAARHYLANGINRVVLLTDGAANLGNVEPESLKQKVEAQRKQGIALDCFGIGWEGFNDDLLEVLSRNGDGRYGFINSPEEAATDFAGQLAGALKVAASDVKVQVEFNPKRVTSYRQIGYAKHQLTKEQFRDNTVDAAEIAAQEAGNALYTVEVNPAGEGPLGTVRVRYKIPGTTDYREQSWDVPFTGNAMSLEQSSHAMRLAASASAFSEWLAASPFAGEVTLDRVLGHLSGVPEIYGADARPKKLEWMIRQAKSIEGK
ncbi:MAG: DUF3520 domain-containing protein [Pedosphaera sp.]|nr:DUF3520 domain-containing protein [Pedosphaera sp.]